MPEETPPAGGRPTPVRPFRRSRADHVGDAAFRLLAKLGVGPAQLLITRGRRTGLPRAVPVVPVRHDGRLYLVAPYGPVPWVHNARAAGHVQLRRGRTTREYAVREVTAPGEAGPVLKRYAAVASATRSWFAARPDSPVAEFAAEADRHPVFALEPAARG
ncbi:nitroreductase family deazaflavin-dependent oxidoreductase [Micromonospora sp. NPDC000089]|uniref:nitroreductase family deazaflavin-dependent oxidoreductase n=1 Tax=unclassified Micromonospora TaxID=2617518 RepID=UPI0036C73503